MSFVLRVVPENLFHLTTQHGPGHGGTARRSVISGVEIALLAEPKIGQVRFFFFSFFSSYVEISTEFSTSARKVRISSDFGISYRGKSSRNRVVRKSSPPSRDGKGKPEEVQTRARTRTRPASPRSARASPRQERERERERSAQGNHVLRRQVLGVSRRKKEEKKNHVTLPNTINPLTRVFLLPSTTQRETLEDRPGGDPSLRYVRVPSPSNTHTHTHSKRASKTDEKD